MKQDIDKSKIGQVYVCMYLFIEFLRKCECYLSMLGYYYAVVVVFLIARWYLECSGWLLYGC